MKFKFSVALASLLFLAACETPTDKTVKNTQNTYGGGYEETYNGDTSSEELAVNVSDRVFFSFDSSVLDVRAQNALKSQATWLKENPATNIVIEGHCDERGTREYNLALGERRASAVRNYLASLGVNSSRIGVVSYGKERPAIVGSNDKAWAQNRRSVTVIAK